LDIGYFVERFYGKAGRCSGGYVRIIGAPKFHYKWTVGSTVTCISDLGGIDLTAVFEVLVFYVVVVPVAHLLQHPFISGGCLSCFVLARRRRVAKFIRRAVFIRHLPPFVPYIFVLPKIAILN
jgi:hypothetical protein